jgi:hypothetical protein
MSRNAALKSTRCREGPVISDFALGVNARQGNYCWELLISKQVPNWSLPQIGYGIDLPNGTGRAAKSLEPSHNDHSETALECTYEPQI